MSTTEQIFNLRILCEKYLQHQQDLYHVFIDFKKAFDRVWLAALWATMKKYNISTNLIRVMKNLYDKATSAVLFNSSKGDWLRTTVEVRQGCRLSPTLFNIFLERITTDALEDQEGTVSIRGRTITNLRFADDIDGLAGEEEELAKLVERLDKASTAYGMEISAEKTKLVTKKHQWHRHKDENNWTEAWDCHKLQVLGLIYNWWGYQARDTLQDSTDNSIDKTQTSLKWQVYFTQVQDTIDALPCRWHLPVCLWIMDSQQSSKEEYKPWKWGATGRY